MQTTIVPVPVYPRMATRLYIRSIGLGPPPSYYYELQAVDVVTKEREIPNPAYVPESTDADGNLVPAQGNPTITESYTEEVVTPLKNGNVDMTMAQWDGWAEDADDEQYQLDCISANLSLTRA